LADKSDAVSDAGCRTSDLPYSDFSEAARGVVEFLHERIGLDLWLVTQVQDGRQLAVVAHPEGAAPAGLAIPWAEGFCSRMASGQGPRVASVTAAVPAYAGLALGKAHRVAAYVGVPLLRADGGIFGTLCGFATRAQPWSLNRHLPLVEQTARLLSTVLAQEGAVVAQQQELRQVLADSERDALTGVLNRRGWERALEVEEARCRRTHGCASLLALDLDGLKAVNDTCGHAAGDDYLRRVAAVLQENSRPTDVIARTGGDEFAVLLVGPASGGTADAGEVEQANEAYLQRLFGALAAAGCSVSVGLADADSETGLVAAWCQADHAMYQMKTARRAGQRDGSVAGVASAG
jgi:diguanylate cyclase (GGDEF)-like protein